MQNAELRSRDKQMKYSADTRKEKLSFYKKCNYNITLKRRDVLYFKISPKRIISGAKRPFILHFAFCILHLKKSRRSAGFFYLIVPVCQMSLA